MFFMALKTSNKINNFSLKIALLRKKILSVCLQAVIDTQKNKFTFRDYFSD